jgi:hypothetical protein
MSYSFLTLLNLCPYICNYEHAHEYPSDFRYIIMSIPMGTSVDIMVVVGGIYLHV